MMKGERDDLIKLIKQRERVERTAAEARSKDLVADLEHQLGTIRTERLSEVCCELFLTDQSPGHIDPSVRARDPGDSDTILVFTSR
jgi:hypothetical protein